MKPNLVLVVLGALGLCGCQTYQYHITQPATGAPVSDKAAVAVHCDPLDYRFSCYKDHLAVNITNPTDNRVMLQGARSYAVDPKGESHPLRDRVIAPHSFTRLLLPPIPFTYANPNYWGPGWGWGPGWYDPYWGGAYGPWLYGPPPAIPYERTMTAYDWEWKTGPVRLRLDYEINGTTLEHDFEIVRERIK
jgi:hypothetical protein